MNWQHPCLSDLHAKFDLYKWITTLRFQPRLLPNEKLLKSECYAFVSGHKNETSKYSYTLRLHKIQISTFFFVPFCVETKTWRKILCVFERTMTTKSHVLSKSLSIFCVPYKRFLSLVTEERRSGICFSRRIVMADGLQLVVFSPFFTFFWSLYNNPAPPASAPSHTCGKSHRHDSVRQYQCRQNCINTTLSKNLSETNT